MARGHEDFSFSADVKTLTADNIIIDKLRMGAYTARVDTLSNNGQVASWTAPTDAMRNGKFFPRGARGFIRTIEVYCKDLGAYGGTVYVSVSPAPYLGAVCSGSIAVPAGGGAAWRSWSAERMWNYDSLFIYVYTSSSSIAIGFDTGGPDGFTSSDAGLNWTAQTVVRYWIRAQIVGMTVGDIPVSGTLNTIEVPNKVAVYESATIAVPPNTEILVKEFTGTGTLLYARLRAWHEFLTWRIYVDGCLFKGNLAGDVLNVDGFGNATPGFSLTKYQSGGLLNVILVTLPIPFQRNIQFKAFHSTAADVNVYAEIGVALLS